MAANEEGKRVILFGDSMTDTLDFQRGHRFVDLEQALKKLSPELSTQLINHGVAGYNVYDAYTRLTTPIVYRGETLTPVLQTGADLVVLESLAYSHMSNTQKDLAKFERGHQRIVQTLQTNGVPVLLLATVAPNRDLYTKYIPTMDRSEKLRLEEYETVMDYFNRFLSFAGNSGLPFVDV